MRQSNIQIRLSLVIAQFAMIACCGKTDDDVGAKSIYPFVGQSAENTSERYICLGLAGSIACLEESTEVEGVESSEDLASRIWSYLTDPKVRDEEFKYHSETQLLNGMVTRSCSKAAIHEIGLLVQKKYGHLRDIRLWVKEVRDPDPLTFEGRVILEKRQMRPCVMHCRRSCHC